MNSLRNRLLVPASEEKCNSNDASNTRPIGRDIAQRQAPKPKASAKSQINPYILQEQRNLNLFRAGLDYFSSCKQQIDEMYKNRKNRCFKGPTKEECIIFYCVIQSYQHGFIVPRDQKMAQLYTRKFK